MPFDTNFEMTELVLESLEANRTGHENAAFLFLLGIASKQVNRVVPGWNRCG